MKKIPTLFIRDFNLPCPATREVTPGCEWVIAGEGFAARKWDGTCCLIKDNKIYKRYDAKRGKTPPDGFIAAQEPDEKTGHWPGWLLVGEGPEDQWHREAFRRATNFYPDGTYELLGPKVQGNPENIIGLHGLVPHRMESIATSRCERNYDGILEFLRNLDIEGIVWHHPDGRMCKIKKSDFRLPRKPEVSNVIPML